MHNMSSMKTRFAKDGVEDLERPPQSLDFLLSEWIKSAVESLLRRLEVIRTVKGD